MLSSHLLKLNSLSIVLASQSPQRKQILNQLGLTAFQVFPSSFAETLPHAAFDKPQDYVKATAKGKLENVLNNPDLLEYEPQIVIAGDSIGVTQKGIILEKPGSRAEAIQMIQTLQGSSHQIMTAVLVAVRVQSAEEEEEKNQGIESYKFKNESGDLFRVFQAVEKTSVYFSALDDALIEDYVDSAQPYQNACAYAIQGKGAMLVSKIEGCYYNVVGLPLNVLCKLLTLALKC